MAKNGLDKIAKAAASVEHDESDLANHPYIKHNKRGKTWDSLKSYGRPQPAPNIDRLKELKGE